MDCTSASSPPAPGAGFSGWSSAAGARRWASAARLVHEQERASSRDGRHPDSWLDSLERYAFPRIRNRLVSEVTSRDVLEVLMPIWHRKASTARQVRQRLHAVLEWAVAMKLRVDNPCDRVGRVLGPQRSAVSPPAPSAKDNCR